MTDVLRQPDGIICKGRKTQRRVQRTFRNFTAALMGDWCPTFRVSDTARRHVPVERGQELHRCKSLNLARLSYLPYFSAHKTHFFSPKYVTQIRRASYAPRLSIISKLINTRTSIIHLYRDVVRFASKSWDLASLLVNGLLSYPGIYPNVYIASHVIPGIHAAAVAKCSQA